MMTFKRISTASMIVGALLAAQGAWAVATPTMIDLRSVSEGGVDQGDITTNLGTVTFVVDQLQPTGTGVLDPFVRIQRNGDEQGFNTTVNNQGSLPFDEKFGIWTHDVLISDLETNAAGTHYQFVLDIGENNSDNQNGRASLLSLDGVRLYAASYGGLDKPQGVDANGDWAAPGDMQLLWDMDAAADGSYLDNWVLLDANRDGNPPGNGVSDMRMDVPIEIINAAAAGNTYFVLWSRFGLMEQAQNGSGSHATFEEWAHVTNESGGGGGPGGDVPVPAPLVLIGLGGVLLGWRHRRTRV